MEDHSWNPLTGQDYRFGQERIQAGAIRQGQIQFTTPISFGYADNFDASNNFILNFFIPTNTRSIQQILAHLLFLPYRSSISVPAFTGSSGADGTEATSTPTPTTTDTSGTGTTDISGGGTSGTESATHTHTGPSHNHTVTIGDNASHNTINITATFNTSNSQFDWNDSISHGFATVSTSSAGTGATGTESATHTHSTPSHGHTTPNHSHSLNAHTHSGPSHTHTINHTHTVTYGLNLTTYPAGVTFLIDGIDQTTNLGGPWNPTSTNASFTGIDITKYVVGTGLHTIQLTTTQAGRCYPLIIADLSRSSAT